MSDIVKKIKEKLDIVDIIKEYIPLQPAGRNFKALCPFHKEKTPSFIVSPERQSWRCFGQCNEGGDVISFVMKYENVDFYTALKNLANKAGVELKNISFESKAESRIVENINRAATDFFKSQLQSNKNALDYIKKRKINDESIETFEIGFSPNEKDAVMIHLTNLGFDISDIEKSGLVFKTRSGTFMDRFRGRIIFPIYNTFGTVVAFSGRILPEFDDGNVAKYINSPDSPIYHKSKILYGYHLAKTFIREKGSAIIVEGNVDTIMLWQDGVRNAVAVSGTALTTEHLNILKRVVDSVVFAFDNDEAGIAANEKAIDIASQLDIFSEVVLIKDGKDMADFISENPGRARNYIEANKIAALEFYLSRYLHNFDEQGDLEKKKNIRKILEKTSAIKSPVEKFRWIKKISEVSKISESALSEEIETISKNKPMPSIEHQQNINTSITSKDVLSGFQTRPEKISLRILKLFMLSGKMKSEIKKYEVYFPKSIAPLLDSIVYGNESSDDNLREIISYLEMESSLENISDKKIENEISFLLKELKKESLKSRMAEIKEKIKVAENSGNHDDLENLLKEFDEIAKMLNT